MSNENTQAPREQGHPNEFERGYVNYFEILDVTEGAKPGEVRKNYRRMMKDLVLKIAGMEMTEARRDHYLLEMAKLNAALVVLRDPDVREEYWRARQELIELEADWREAVNAGASDTDNLRREYDGKLQDFLSRYIEELMLDAGRDKECVEASGWDAAHERHASRLLRHYRNSLYQEILERLPYFQITPPRIDWEERRASAARILDTIST